MDAAKALIGMGVALLAKGLINTFVGIIGGGLIAISAGVFVVSLFAAFGLYILDDYFGISKSIIDELKNSKRGSKAQDLRHDFHQGFNLIGRYSRG